MSLIDVIIVCIFLCSILYVGLKSSRNVKTFKDYALGTNRFSNFVIFCTLAASCIGGTSTMGCIGKTYSVGIAQLIVQLGVPLSLLIVSLVLARRFYYYHGCYSLGDMFFRAYGKSGKLLAGLTGCVYETISSGIQFMGMATALSILTNLSYVPCLLISASIVFIYTGKGGIRAVTFTDVLQFIVLIIAIPLLLIIVLNQIGGVDRLFEMLPVSHSTVSGDVLHRYLFLALPFMLPTLSPIYVQRFLMARGYEQGSKACYKVFWVYLVIVIMSVLLGLCARVLLPELSHADKALVTLVGQYLPVGIYGFVVAGILAVLMSTVDSQLNSGSIMFVNDVIAPLCRENLTEHAKLILAKWSSWIIGIAAIVFASFSKSIFEVKVIGKSLWLSVLLVPLYFLLFNKKVPLKGLFISSSSGLGTILLWNFFIKPLTKIDGLFPGVFVSLFLTTLFYFIGGRQKVFSDKEMKQMNVEARIPDEKNFVEKSYKAQTNIWLGICLICIQMVPLLFGSGSVTNVKIALIMLNGTMAVLLIFGSTLEIFQNHKQIFDYFKQATLFLCLPLTSVYLLFSSEENGLHLVAWGISFFIMMLVVEDKHREKTLLFCLALFLVALGFAFKSNFTVVWPSIFCWWHMFYILGFLAVILLLRASMHTLAVEREKAILLERCALARGISHDIMTPMMVMRMLLKKPGSIDEKERTLMLDTLKEMGGIVDSVILESYKEYKNLHLENLNTIVDKCVSRVCFLRKNLTIHLNSSEEMSARVDTSLLNRILTNLLNMGCRLTASNGGELTVDLEKDSYDNIQLGLYATPSISVDCIRKAIQQNDSLIDETGLGFSIRDLQKIVKHWHGLLMVKESDDEKYLFRIVLPNENNSEIIGYEIDDEDI